MNTPILTMLYRNGLWISAPLFVIAAVLLGHFILSIIRLERTSKILSLPLREEQNVEFGEAGPVVLCLKGPQFTTRFAGLTYELDAEDGTPVKSRRLWMRPTTSGISTATIGIRLYQIPRPGNYALLVRGLKSDEALDDRCEILFTRPHLARAVANVIGIVFSAILLIGSLVFFLIRLLSNRA
jgi:hypothetical protein